MPQPGQQKHKAIFVITPIDPDCTNDEVPFITINPAAAPSQGSNSGFCHPWDGPPMPVGTPLPYTHAFFPDCAWRLPVGTDPTNTIVRSLGGRHPPGTPTTWLIAAAYTETTPPNVGGTTFVNWRKTDTTAKPFGTYTGTSGCEIPATADIDPS